MNPVRVLGVALMFTLLLFGSVLVFLAFDRNSHSASDTIRPFVVTVAPVWIVAVISAAILFRKTDG
jgi:hypothetical protein